MRVPEVDVVERVLPMVWALVLALTDLNTCIMECQGGEEPDETRIERAAEQMRGAERGGAVLDREVVVDRIAIGR